MRSTRQPGDARDQIGDPRVALPPVLVRALEAVEPRDELRCRRVGRVPDLVRLVAERAQHVDGVRVALRQALAVAHAHHLCAAVLGQPLVAGDVEQVFGAARVGDIDERGAVELVGAGQRIARLGDLLGAAVVADVGDPSAALAVDGRLIGAARLQIVAAQQRHVLGFGLRLSQRRRSQRHDASGQHEYRASTPTHASLQRVSRFQSTADDRVGTGGLRHNRAPKVEAYRYWPWPHLGTLCARHEVTARTATWRNSTWRTP